MYYLIKSKIMLFFYSCCIILFILAIFSVGFYTAVLYLDFSIDKAEDVQLVPTKKDTKSYTFDVPIHKKLDVWKVGHETEILNKDYQIAWDLKA